MKSHWSAKRRLRKNYAVSASIYNLMYSLEQRIKYEAALSMVKLKEGDIVLDNGCGSGLLTQRIASEKVYVVAVDLCMSLLRIAGKSKVRKVDRDFICCDVENLPFRNRVFHKVFAITVLQNLPCTALSLKEMVRVGTNGCRFIVTFLKRRFPLKTSEKLLQNARLNVLDLKDTTDLRDYVFVCIKANDIETS